MSDLDNYCLLIREDTQDRLELVNVLVENAYGLPAELDPALPVLDVGANIGTFALACAARGASDIHCLEPHPDNYAVLAKNIQANAPPGAVFGLTRAALWREAGTVRLNFAPPGCTSMHSVLGRAPRGATVPCATLDDLLAARPRWGVVKLDCEGAEWPALLESKLLGRVGLLYAELHLRMPVPGYDCTPEAVSRRLSEFGFRVMTRAVDPGGCNLLLVGVGDV